ncbi:hypothetical protein SESBI_04224 [Sesbania bispinosa]|nr:hypothetical protein SESBI_04224 [Sesbania bispinosa]
MAMGPERSKPLHNFMLPCLKWGNQRYLRCMKVPPDAGDRRSPVPTRKRELEPPANNARDSDKRLRMTKPRIHGDDGIDAASGSAGVRPWNLRTRRAAGKAPVAGDSGKGLKIEEKKPNSSPLRTHNGAVKSPKLRSSPEKVNFSLPLSRKEIEEDFMQLVGHRPPRRPKKRPRNVQKQLDCLFPGLWLSEITADSYKVPETPENGNKR